jgi:CheY-like chemotaxis protein
MIPSQPQLELDTEDEFNALREEYVFTLPKRLEALGELIEIARRGRADTMLAATIESHKIRGTARIFGLPQVSKAMTDLEETLTLAADQPDRLADLLQNKAKTLLHTAYEALCLNRVEDRHEHPQTAADEADGAPVEQPIQMMKSEITNADGAQSTRSLMKIETVMLVDDDALIRKIGQMTLTRVGNWTVILAESGARAIELIPEAKPDVILLDVMMPDMDGPTTLRLLKEAGTDTPVIFMTAKIQKHELAAYYELGAAGVIAKPFDPLTLPAEIQDILNAA